MNATGVCGGDFCVNEETKVGESRLRDFVLRKQRAKDEPRNLSSVARVLSSRVSSLSVDWMQLLGIVGWLSVIKE